MSARYRTQPVLHDVSVSFGPGLHLISAEWRGEDYPVPCHGGHPASRRRDVRVLGRDPAADVAVKSQVGMAAHRSALAQRLSVADNLHYWARVLSA